MPTSLQSHKALIYDTSNGQGWLNFIRSGILPTILLFTLAIGGCIDIQDAGSPTGGEQENANDIENTSPSEGTNDRFQVDATASTTSGTSSLTVDFSTIVSGGNETFSYQWDFGDASAGSGASPSHTYSTVSGTRHFTATLTVTDADGNTARDTVDISVTAAAPLALNGIALEPATEGISYSDTIPVQGGAAPYTWQHAGGDPLPNGLTLDTATGDIAGTPESASSGEYSLSLSVMDKNGNTATAPITLTVNAGVASCQVPSLSSRETVYYVCDCQAGADADCEVGDDSNTGTSPSAPFRTHSRAAQAFQTMNAGDAVAFCKGGAIAATASSQWTNQNCTTDQPCSIRDYTPAWADSDTPSPRIVASGGANGFVFENGGNAVADGGYTLGNLRLQADGSGYGIFVYNDSDDLSMCNLEIDRFAIGVHVGGANTANPGSDGSNDRISLLDSRITNNSAQGWLGGGDGTRIERSYFENNGYALPVFNHNIYINDASNQVASDVVVRGNELYQSTLVDGQCQGASLVAHGEFDNLLIEDNIVREDVGAATGHCWGIAIDTAYFSAEAFRNVTVRGNSVINTGGVGIGLNSCTDCTVENNVIVNEQSGAFSGISIPDRDRSVDDLPMSDVTVRNNSIYLNTLGGGMGIALGGEGNSHRLLSNAIHYAGSSDNWSCIDLDLLPSAYDSVNNNLCHYPNAGSGEWARGWGDLNAWRNATGFDIDSLKAAPDFVSTHAGAYDLRPDSANSPLIDAGHPGLSASHDRSGSIRDAQPDIGAYEHLF